MAMARLPLPMPLPLFLLFYFICCSSFANCFKLNSSSSLFVSTVAEYSSAMKPD